jgi:TetR/AcrR family transcriptional regulator, fatty acid biosynthesis regulator
MKKSKSRRDRAGVEAGKVTYEELVSRQDRKLRTRDSLMDAALTLMSQGRSFGSLSLREITREAGVVPTAFYRHFRDMDELGLALVEGSGLILRRLLREARKHGVPSTEIIRSSVTIYKKYVEENPRYFLVAARERLTGSPLMRYAIRTEVNHFINEMAQDLRDLRLIPQLSMESLRMICGLVVITMLNAASDILDLPPGQPQAEQELVDNFVRQLTLIFLGAGAWREPSPRPAETS